MKPYGLNELRKKYLEFFERYCYGENLYVKILFEK